MLDCLDRSLCVAVQLWVMMRRYDVADSPTLQESFEFPTGEMGSTVCPETYWNFQVMEDVAEVTNSGCTSVWATGYKPQANRTVGRRQLGNASPLRWRSQPTLTRRASLVRRCTRGTPAVDWAAWPDTAHRHRPYLRYLCWCWASTQLTLHSTWWRLPGPRSVIPQRPDRRRLATKKTECWRGTNCTGCKVTMFLTNSLISVLSNLSSFVSRLAGDREQASRMRYSLPARQVVVKTNAKIFSFRRWRREFSMASNE